MRPSLFEIAQRRVLDSATRKLNDLFDARPAILAADKLIDQLRSVGFRTDADDMYDGNIYAVHIIVHHPPCAVFCFLDSLGHGYHLTGRRDNHLAYVVDVEGRQINLLIPAPTRTEEWGA
jgi:hypothetical protein